MKPGHRSFEDLARSLKRPVTGPDRPVVCIQGLGFVGLATGVAIASAKDETGQPIFRVVGVDLPTREGLDRIKSINEGILPFKTNDRRMIMAFERAHKNGLLLATCDLKVFSLASVTLVSINLDLQGDIDQPSVNLEGFRRAIRTLGTFMPPDSLIILETTVPPGTCEKVVVPEIRDSLKERGLPEDAILVAHSYERVMPGDHYLDSIINYWRVYAGHTESAADMCGEFLSKVINVKAYPLTRLRSTTASELAKVLENSYRAVNIAFIEEWGRFAEAIGVDLFEVITAIRKRPTHSNIRQPGFGVGGYCLTKDPLFAKVAARDYFDLENQEFPFCERAIRVNAIMPLVSLDYIRKHFNGNLEGKKILLLGVSYRQDIGDTRYSPSQVFAEKAFKLGATIIPCDPLLDYWPELDLKVHTAVPDLDGVDVVVFAVQHQEFSSLDLMGWLKGHNPLIFDANNVISTPKLLELRNAKYTVQAIGRGCI